MNDTIRKLIAGFIPALLLLLATGSAKAEISGAIFTTTSTGTTVNGNIYAAAENVYLNGGPQNNNGSLLPNGTYFFQVTTPSGAMLLSTDAAVNRQVVVSGGRITGVVPTGTVTPYGTVTQAHATGTLNGANGNLPVQLIPFNPTDNNGGEYKVWLIAQENTTTIVGDPTTSPVLDFNPSDSKTDNFKLRVQPCVGENCGPKQTVSISGHKFYDANVNSKWDTGEAGLNGVPIFINVTPQPGDGDPYQDVVFTADDPDGHPGFWHDDIPLNSTYEVCEGVLYTNAAAAAGLPPTSTSYWVQTVPAPDANGHQCYTSTNAVTDDAMGLDFGNVCFSPGTGGLTLGYWSNKNGQAILKKSANDPAWRTLLNALCLADANGNNYDVLLPPCTFDKAYTAFRTWLLGATATNMAYMLSAQLAATELDVAYAGLNGNAIVDARTICCFSSTDSMTGTCPGPGFFTINCIMKRANCLLCSTGGNYTVAGKPLRAKEECYKNLLDSINNNKLFFASDKPCPIYYATDVNGDPVPPSM